MMDKIKEYNEKMNNLRKEMSDLDAEMDRLEELRDEKDDELYDLKHLGSYCSHCKMYIENKYQIYEKSEENGIVTQTYQCPICKGYMRTCKDYVDCVDMKNEEYMTKLSDESKIPKKCERCGANVKLKTISMGQLVPKDGNKYNRLIENIFTVCPNCHALYNQGVDVINESVSKIGL